MDEKRFYVYGHYTADTDELFYIGKGTGKRAWATSTRNRQWYQTVKDHGLVVKILVDGLTTEESYIKERELIEQIGQHKLTNMTAGGEGLLTEHNKKNHIPRIQRTPHPLRKCTDPAHNDIYIFPNGKRTCRICFRNRVREWRKNQRK